MLAMQRMQRLLVLASVSLVTACTGISQPVSVSGIKQVIGTELPGAQGLTEVDQTKIDLTVARLCATRLYDAAKCKEHTEASRLRRVALK